MKKLLFFLFPAFLLLSGCFKPNSTTPITSTEQQMNGSWQVDSTHIISYDNWRTDPVTGYVQPYRTTSDSMFKSHFLNVASSGNMVTITMPDHNVMRYTISGTSLSPYVSTSALPSLSFSHGCGLDYVPNNQVNVTDHSMIITSYQLSSIAFDTSVTYMHR
jgi:hypothetical protein